MAEAQTYKTQEIVPSGRVAPPVAPGPNPWKAGFQLVSMALNWLNDQALKNAIEYEVTTLRAKMDGAMPKQGGVLVVVGVQESVLPDVNGNRARSVLEAHIGGAGATPKETLDGYVSQTNLEKGPDKGYQRRNVYFWVTR